MDTALAKQHLDIGLVRLWVQVVDQEHGKIYFLSYYHCCNFGISTQRTGMHTGDIRRNTFFFHRLPNQISGCPSTYDMMMGQKFSIVNSPFYHVSLPVVGDAGELIRGLLAEAKKRGADKEYPLFKGEDWRKQCLLWKKKYPVVTEKHYETLEEGCTNIYAFYGELSKAMKENETLMVSVGTSRVAGSQAFQVKKGQRFITNPNTASMGFCLPAATGIAFCRNIRYNRWEYNLLFP